MFTILALFVTLAFGSGRVPVGGSEGHVTCSPEVDFLCATIGVGSASIRGFSWTYDVVNPDLTDPVGKIYWVLADDGVTLTADDIRNGNNPTQPNCFGSANQEDTEVHELRMDCTLTAGTMYKHWVVVDYDGDGTQQLIATPGGVPVIPQEDKDCDGIWSTCDSNCMQSYTITQYPSGDGAGCEIGDEEERQCEPGSGECPNAVVPCTLDTTDSTYSLTGATVSDCSATDCTNAVLSGASCNTQNGFTGTPQVQGCENEKVKLTGCVASGPTPTVVLSAGSPTDTGYTLQYTVTNSNPSGKFYYLTLPEGSPTPTPQEIMSGSSGSCAANAQQVDDQVKTVQVQCPLTTGNYMIWGAVDSDGNGADVSLANGGVAYTFSYQSSGGAEGTGNFRVLAAGHECENDQLHHNIHDTILLPNVRAGKGSDVMQCANFVAANVASNGGCSNIFHSGGYTGECRCVRQGWTCDEDESEHGRSIFELCVTGAACVDVHHFDDWEAMHGRENPEFEFEHPEFEHPEREFEHPEREEPEFETGYDVIAHHLRKAATHPAKSVTPAYVYVIVALAGLLFGSIVGVLSFNHCNKKTDTNDHYHMSLVDEPQRV